MTIPVKVLACPLCSHQFSHEREADGRNLTVFGYGLDFRLVPRDCNRSSELATCPECLYTARVQDFSARVPGHIKDLVKSDKYVGIFKKYQIHEFVARKWIALISIFETRGLNPRDLAVMSLKGSWAAREYSNLKTETELLDLADSYLEEALRRGLTKGDPGLIMYLLGEVNRRRGDFRRGREMLAFLGNNPRYRYPALLETVLIEEEDTTPYWSHHAPDQMELHSHKFKGLFPSLRSIPPGKTEFYPDELKESMEKPEDDRHKY